MSDAYQETRDKIAAAREKTLAELAADVEKLRALEGPFAIGSTCRALGIQPRSIPQQCGTLELNP